MSLPPYQLSEYQIEEKKQKIILDNHEKEDFDITLVDIPKLGYITIDRAIALPLDYKFMPNILKWKFVPEWITRDELKLQFVPYATDPTAVHHRHVKGRFIEETYPFVNINEDGVAFVIFDPSTNDAQFALHMMKKTVIKKRLHDGRMVMATLIFSHSFRTDRDKMSDIIQKPKVCRQQDYQRVVKQKEDVAKRGYSQNGTKTVQRSFVGKNSFGQLRDEMS
jgi:hypothetical protein